MRRLLPKSLFGQTVMILLAGLIISQAAGWWIFSLDREQAVRAVGGFAAAERIANLTRLVREAPQDWRTRIVAALSDESFHVSLTSQPLAMTDTGGESGAAKVIRDFLIGQLPAGSGRQPIVSVSGAVGPPFAGFHGMRPGPMMAHMNAMGAFGAFRALQVAVPLPDGKWLSFRTALVERGPAFSRQFLVSLGVMAVIVLAVAVWAVRRVTAPLASLSAAATRLGDNLNASPIPETGTIETRQASRAFNAMQARVRGLIENRTRMLAAISHDLRTSLTLLRLRVENVEDRPEREKMLETIAEMDSMIGATLDFAREVVETEPPRRTDITALVESVVDDMADAGLPVAMKPAPPAVMECRPGALRRALRNLVDNAVKYGKSADVSVEVGTDAIGIVIDDQGPGIPQRELDRVFQPFYRIEGSRNPDTGGIGLGLAIALSIVEAHGGRLKLANREAGGLRASVLLPR